MNNENKKNSHKLSSGGNGKRKTVTTEWIAIFIAIIIGSATFLGISWVRGMLHLESKLNLSAIIQYIIISLLVALISYFLFKDMLES